MVGLVINFFLAPGADSMIKSHTSGGVTTNYSQSFQLKDAKCLCSMITLDDGLSESFQSQLLAGSAIKIPFRKLESIWSYIPTSATSGKFDVPMSRAYTRLCSLFASFVQAPPADGLSRRGRRRRHSQ